MHKEQLFAAMDGIDETLIQRSEEAKPMKSALWKWCTLAACFCIVLFAGIFFFGRTEEPDSTQPEKVEYYDRQWVAVYNEKMESPFTSCHASPPGYYREDLSEDQWEEILPGKRGSWQVKSANAGFLVNGEADRVSLILVTNMEGVSDVHLSIGNVGYPFYMGGKTFEKSKCGDQEFMLVRDELPSTAAWKIKLEGYTRIEDVGLHFSMNCNDEEHGKAVFQAVMECFTWYDGEPEMDAVEPSRIPEYRHEKMSYEDALEDPDFGKWFLADVPDGLECSEILRRRDYYSDYLSGNWYDSENGSIRWEAGILEENDKVRITSVSDTQNYDLSLYPPPRADIEPYELERKVSYPIFRIEELTLDAIKLRYERVPGNKYPGNETDDYYKMSFGVLYGDILVDVTTRHIEPEWLYEQLMKLPRS